MSIIHAPDVRNELGHSRLGSKAGQWISSLVFAVLVCSIWIVSTSFTRAEGPNKAILGDITPRNNVSVFQMPGLQANRIVVKRLVALGRYRQAEQALRKYIRRFPEIAISYYDLAVVLSRQRKVDEAFGRLGEAVDRGFSDERRMHRDPNFKSLRRHRRWIEVVTAVRKAAASKPLNSQTPPKSPIVSQIQEPATAQVTERNTVWDRRNNVLKSFFNFDDDGNQKKRVATGKDEASARINEWYRTRRAAGHFGDLYDNHDKDHSSLQRSRFPQLTFVEYGAQAQAAGVHYGLNRRMFFNAITFGNSSTAVAGGPYWRGLARLAMTRPGMARILYLHYHSNQLYVYPEHQDHDPKHGDVVPANTPYTIISQGSSGSDQKALHAVAYILAAFRPEVKDYLRRTKLVMPTVQMIFRRGQRQIKSDADYMSGKAHPTAFEPKNTDFLKMVELANELRIKDVPPMVRLTVLQEDKAKQGVDFFAPTLTEKLFDTPSAIARVMRSTVYEKRMVVSAAQTNAPDGTQLRFHWKVLRGDASRISIKPLNAESSVVEIIVPWHERRPVPGTPKLLSDRVDIGAFVDNGKHFSAPAFISLLYPGNQKRVYDQRKKIVSVSYNDKRYGVRYVDPWLFPVRDWSDAYLYDKQGRLIGWRRSGAGINIKGRQFTRHGATVIETDRLGRPVEAQVPDYILERTKGGLSRVSESLRISKQSRPRLFYRYSGSDDWLGGIKKKGQR